MRWSRKRCGQVDADARSGGRALGDVRRDPHWRKPVGILNPHDSRALGIDIIYQEPALAPEPTVAENIFLSELPGLVNAGRLQRLAAELPEAPSLNTS